MTQTQTLTDQLKELRLLAHEATRADTTSKDMRAAKDALVELCLTIGLDQEQQPAKPDAIRPSHYSPDSVEAITAMRAWLTPEQFAGFLHGNAIKYLSRMNFKDNPLQDAEKAQQYLHWLVELVKGRS